MRKITRLDAPSAWAEHQEQWNSQWVARVNENPKAGFAWYTHAGRSARDIALPVLKAQTQDQCSFCGAFPFDHVSPETIEHFRPKAKRHFPQYAYTWTNLYYCCQSCQGSKGEKWDDLLLAPDEFGYSFAQYFEFDFVTGQIRPAATATPDEAIRAGKTISVYGLDTDQRRRERRRELRNWQNTAAEKRDLIQFGYRDFLDPAVFAPAVAADSEQIPTYGLTKDE